MKRSLQHIAEAVGARLIGDPEVIVNAVASIGSASPDDLVFVDDEKHLAAALESSAGAVIAGEFAETFAVSGRPLLVSDHPKLAFARAARVLREAMPLEGSIRQGSVHPTAVVHSSVVLGPGVLVDERAVVGERAGIGQNTRIGAGCALGTDVRIGRDCEIY